MGNPQDDLIQIIVPITLPKPQVMGFSIVQAFEQIIEPDKVIKIPSGGSIAIGERSKSGMVWDVALAATRNSALFYGGYRSLKEAVQIEAYTEYPFVALMSYAFSDLMRNSLMVHNSGMVFCKYIFELKAALEEKLKTLS